MILVRIGITDRSTPIIKLPNYQIAKLFARQLRKNFWTTLGQYMSPLPGRSGEVVNWLNYKTGVKNLYFRMDVGDGQASIAIELHHADPAERHLLFEKLRALRPLLENTLQETWDWQEDVVDEDGETISRIGTRIENVNLSNTADWPSIISFLKPRMLSLDEFWEQVRDGFY